MVAEAAALAVGLLSLAAEGVHQRRIRAASRLAFGPGGRPAPWTCAAPFLQAGALAALAWGFVTLLLLPPKNHSSTAAEKDFEHLVLLLDVSPSMQLADAGPKREQLRAARVGELVDSMLQRASLGRFRISVVAFYTDAKAVCVDTRDRDVLHNILHGLPMNLAFKSGRTDLFAGLREAARVAKPWKPGSATLLVLSDGDTVPAQGMPKLPPSIRRTLVVGVGDPRAGKFIDGRQSRQEASSLAQLATRLGGTFHDGNEKHIPTDLARDVLSAPGGGPLARLTLREYAMIACLLGGLVHALLPLALQSAGTTWTSGVRKNVEHPLPRRPAAAVGV